MIWNNKFNYPKSSRSIEDGLRKYLVNNQKLPSVTSILQQTKSDEDKAALKNWIERVGPAVANKIKNYDHIFLNGNLENVQGNLGKFCEN